MSHFSDAEAVEIWISHWLGTPTQKLIQKYDGCNNWRFYEIFQEDVNIGSRQEAERELYKRHPHLQGKIDTSPHIPKKRMVARKPSDWHQPDLFLQP